jgi:hypothetical protein
MAMKIQPRDGVLQARSAAGLTYRASTAAGDGVFAQFFAAYDNAFVLENEKEGLSGFAECLALNDGAGYQALRCRYGPFREFVVVVRDPSETVVGGLNFITFPLPDPDGTERLLSLNLNYIFVVPSQRRRGLFRTIVGDLPSLALALFRHTNAPDAPAEWDAHRPTIYTFIEQNDPYRMTPQDYLLDTQATGLDFADDDGWNLVLDNYRRLIEKDAFYATQLRELRSFLFNCWLLWGPSIQPCSCENWKTGAGAGAADDLMIQYGYGDENNSIDILVKGGLCADFRAKLHAILNKHAGDHLNAIQCGGRAVHRHWTLQVGAKPLRC